VIVTASRSKVVNFSLKVFNSILSSLEAIVLLLFHYNKASFTVSSWS